MSDKRRMLTVRVSDEARRAIDGYCSSNGITATAWIEALGQRLIELGHTDAGNTPLRVVAEETVRIARRIDAERRSRLTR